jgi:hypothetical protein
MSRQIPAAGSSKLGRPPPGPQRGCSAPARVRSVRCPALGRRLGGDVSRACAPNTLWRCYWTAPPIQLGFARSDRKPFIERRLRSRHCWAPARNPKLPETMSLHPTVDPLEPFTRRVAFSKPFGAASSCRQVPREATAALSRKGDHDVGCRKSATHYAALSFRPIGGTNRRLLSM